MSRIDHIRRIFATLLVLAFVTPSAVLAQGEAPPPPRDPVKDYSDAGAGPEQIEKIRALAKEFEELARVRWQLMVNLQREMKQLSQQAEPDEKTVLSKQDEINKVVSDIATERIRLMLKVRSILTPEQRQKLVEIMQQKKTAASNAHPEGAPHDPASTASGSPH